MVYASHAVRWRRCGVAWRAGRSSPLISRRPNSTLHLTSRAPQAATQLAGERDRSADLWRTRRP